MEAPAATVVEASAAGMPAVVGTLYRTSGRTCIPTPVEYTRSSGSARAFSRPSFSTRSSRGPFLRWISEDPSAPAVPQQLLWLCLSWIRLSVGVRWLLRSVLVVGFRLGL